MYTWQLIEIHLASASQMLTLNASITEAWVIAAENLKDPQVDLQLQKKCSEAHHQVVSWLK